MRERIIERAVPRPVTPVYTELSEILQIALHRALTGQQAPREALVGAAAEMQQLLDRAGLGGATAVVNDDRRGRVAAGVAGAGDDRRDCRVPDRVDRTGNRCISTICACRGSGIAFIGFANYSEALSDRAILERDGAHRRIHGDGGDAGDRAAVWCWR